MMDEDYRGLAVELMRAAFDVPGFAGLTWREAPCEVEFTFTFVILGRELRIAMRFTDGFVRDCDAQTAARHAMESVKGNVSLAIRVTGKTG